MTKSNLLEGGPPEMTREERIKEAHTCIERLSNLLDEDEYCEVYPVELTELVLDARFALRIALGVKPQDPATYPWIKKLSETRPEPSPEAERAYKVLKKGMREPDNHYMRPFLDLLARHAGIKIDGGNEE